MRDPFRQWTDRIGSVRGRTGMSPTGDSTGGGGQWIEVLVLFAKGVSSTAKELSML